MKFFVFIFFIFISIGHFNGDIEEELNTCADITFLPRSPGLLSKTKKNQRRREDKRKEQEEGKGRGEDPFAWLPFITAASFSIGVSYFKQFALV